MRKSKAVAKDSAIALAAKSEAAIVAYGGGENPADRRHRPMVLASHLDRMLRSSKGRFVQNMNAALLEVACNPEHPGFLGAQKMVRDRIDGPVRVEIDQSITTERTEIIVQGVLANPPDLPHVIRERLALSDGISG